MEFEKKINNYFDAKVRDIEVDVEQKVMERINDKDSKVLKYNRGNYRVLIIASIIIFVLGTGFIYKDDIIENVINYLGFNNKDGEVEWSISYDSSLGEDFNTVVQEVFEGLDLKEGEAVAIYVPDNNSNNIVTSRQVPTSFNDLCIVKGYDIGEKVKDLLINKYHFIKGDYVNDFCSPPPLELFYEESRENGNSIIVKKVDTLPKIKSVTFEYKNSDKLILINMMEWYGNQVFVSETLDASKHEKILIGNSEVLYKDETSHRSITWIENGWRYNIYTENKDIPKEELIEIAREIKLK